jgi:type III restriction enzyme
MRPTSWIENTSIREAGNETPIPTYANHLLCDEGGAFPAELNDWERKVVEAEATRKGFSSWYRNPGRASQESMAIPYEHDGQVKLLRPDFVFFATQQDGTVVADIVDPHATHLRDAIPKLQGLAKYAETHPGLYRRVDAVAEVGGKMRVLDLTDGEVRRAVYEVKDVQGLYGGGLAADYE